MLNGLSLFSGIGGIDVALSEWVRPIAYCEIDPYCQGVLLTRMSSGSLRIAPIWDNICTFEGRTYKDSIDIIYGGFPCQDISVAGHGKGLAGERSGLFFEIVRLSKEIKPKFIFLENVPAITSRGGLTVVRAITEMGYDCRWCVISAASIGALHKRERWFLLAYAKHARQPAAEISGSAAESISDAQKGKDTAEQLKGMDTPRDVARGREDVDDPESWTMRDDGQNNGKTIGAVNTPTVTSSSLADTKSEQSGGLFESKSFPHPFDEGNRGFEASWWATEPDVGRVADGISQRVDRLRGLGNAVVSEQAKEAFKILMGLK